MKILRFVDLFDQLTFVDLEGPRASEFLAGHPELSVDDLRHEMHVSAADGSVSRGFYAFRTICGVVPTLWPLRPLFCLPLADRVGPRVYRRVAAGRLRREACEDGSCGRR